MKRVFACLTMIAMIATVACKSRVPTAEETQAVAEQEKGVAMDIGETKKWVEPSKPDVDPAKKYTVIIKTAKGEIVCELYPKETPLSVTNFKYLADNGFYKGLTFHRVVPKFVIQGGDPAGTGAGGPGYTIPAEIGLKHKKGALAWARTGDEVNPERRSSGSQFYITLEATPFLDGGYTVFGQTISGMDIVEQIRQGDVIESVQVKVE